MRPAQPAAREPTPQQLAEVQGLVQGLWSRHKPPVSEIARFLNGAADQAAQEGQAAPLLQVYEEELQRFGALPLVEHASRPELLECWLQALQPGSSSARSATGGGAAALSAAAARAGASAGKAAPQ